MRIDRAYGLLELTPPASLEEVKKAFHRLAHIHHPDKGGDVEKFKEINGAYQFLSQKGYWDTIVHRPASDTDGASRSYYGRKWEDVKRQETYDYSAYKKSFIYDESTKRYCIIDEDGNVISSWSKDPDDAIDATSWRDLDHSVDFKDYNQHLTAGNKRIS